MRARLASVLSAAATLMMLAGCSDRGDPVRVTGPPNGATVSYQNDVRPIFVTEGCTNAGCHGGSSSTDRTGMLSSYANFVNRTSFSYAPALIVKPGDPAGSVLYNKIEDTGLYGELMPFGATSKIPQSERDLIRTWIEQGALEN